MKVLVPVDGSDNSTRALEYVLKMAKSHPSVEVTLVSVACLYDNPYPEALFMEAEANEDCRNRFGRVLDTAKELCEKEGIRVSSALLEGDPANEIIDYVEENGIDKIVMGSRGLSAFKGMVLGSVTYKILSRVKIPVTVVK